MEPADDWERYYALHEGELRRWLLVRVDQAAGDFAQEIWTRIGKGLQRQQFDGGNFRAWMYQIARNFLAEYRRSHGAREDQTDSLQFRGPDGRTVEFDPAYHDASVEEREEQARLLACLEKLDAGKRAVVDVILSSTSYEQLMARFGWTQQYAHNQLRTAKDQLRRCLESRRS